jgi:hypothetical protein
MTEIPRTLSIGLGVIFTLVTGTAFFFVTRSLQRGVGIQQWPVRALLGGLWILSYFLLVGTVGNLLSLAGLKGSPIDAALRIVMVVGIVAMIIRLFTWRRPQTSSKMVDSAPAAAAPLIPTAPERPVMRLSTFLRCAYEGLALPIRRPILFVPFVFYMLVYVLALQAVGLRLETIETIDQPEGYALFGLITIAVLPVFILALELTSHMAAEAELGRPIQLSTSLGRAVRRLPRSLAVNLLYAAGLAAGVLLLVVPFFVWLIRWHLVTQAVMLGNARVQEAFRVSDRVTRGRWWRFALLLLLVGAGQAGLRALLANIPNAGILLSGWVDFAWLTIAMTLAYVRAGGPVD